MRTGCEPGTGWARVTGTACGGEDAWEGGCEGPHGGGVTGCDTYRDISKLRHKDSGNKKKQKLFASQGDV